MKPIVFILIIYFLIDSGCDNSVGYIPNIEGTYNGTYTRTNYDGTDSAATEQGLVTFEFTKRTYRFEGESHFLPPFGSGIYSMDSKFITLTDTVPHYGDSEILEGKFNYLFNENSLILTQNDTKYIYERRHEFELIKKN